MKGQIRNIYPGGNTPEGFYSYYNDILPQRDAARIFCIKGGPGTGKSTLMKEIGRYFNDKNESVDFLWCSSDPDSLDGILLRDRRIAIFDGTAPHIIDPVNPGAVDEIVSLGLAWDEEGLRNCRRKIISCNERIGETFKLAYGYLKCARSQYDVMALLLEHLLPPSVMQDYRRHLEMKINGITAVRRAESRVGKNMAMGTVTRLGQRKKRFASAITPAGIRNDLPSIINDIEKVILLELPDGLSARTMLVPVAERLAYAGMDVEEYYCPMNPEQGIEHLVSSEAGLAIVTCNSYHSIGTDECSGKVMKIRVSWEEETPSEYSERLEAMQKESAETIEKALQILKQAKKYHDTLEECYISNMDFMKINETKQQIIDKIESI